MSGESFSDSNGDLRGLKTAPAGLWHQKKGTARCRDRHVQCLIKNQLIMPERRCNFGVHEPAHEAAEERSFISKFCDTYLSEGSS